MGVFGDAIARNRPVAPNAVPPTPSAAPTPSAPSTAAPGVDPHAELRRRRDALAAQVTELHWDLGGLAYEMAIRDHFRLDVLVRRAAVLQERDAELAELERLMRMDGMAGSCPHCSAPHSRGALFCWQCGTTLMERLANGSAANEEGTTEIIDALFSEHTHESLSPAQE